MTTNNDDVNHPDYYLHITLLLLLFFSVRQAQVLTYNVCTLIRPAVISSLCVTATCLANVSSYYHL